MGRSAGLAVGFYLIVSLLTLLNGKVNFLTCKLIDCMLNCGHDFNISYTLTSFARHASGSKYTLNEWIGLFS